MSKPTCWCGGSISYKSAADERPFQPMCQDSAYHDPFATGRKTSVHKLYIAGPMTGIPDCNYPLFNEVAEMLRLAEYEVINPAEVSAGQRAHYVDYLREDLRAMLDCDGVALLPDWEFSTGARNEVNVAGLLKMPVKTYNDWIVNRQRYLLNSEYETRDEWHVFGGRYESVMEHTNPDQTPEKYGSQPALRRIEAGEVRPGMVVRVTVQQEDWVSCATFRVDSIIGGVAQSKSGAAWAIFDGVHAELVEDQEMILRDELAERLALSSGFVWGSMPELSREHYRNLAEEAIRWATENKEKK